MSAFLARSFFWVTLSEIIYNVSGYIIHSVLGRIMGPADYGRYGIVVTLTTMVIILIGNGVPTAMAKYLSELFEENKGIMPVIKKQAAILQAVIIGATTLIFFLASPLISIALKDPSLTRLFQISSLIIPSFALASFYFSFYTGLHLFFNQAILKTVRSVARIIFIIGLAWFFGKKGQAVEGSIIGYIFAPIVVFMVAYLINPYRSLKPEGYFSWKLLVKYAWPVTLFMIFYEFMITADLYLLKALMRDDFLTGLYNAAVTVGRIPYYIFYSLTIILLPAVSKFKADDVNGQNTSNRLVGESLRLMLVFLMPMALLMSLYSRQLISIFYSSKFSEAAGAMQILMAGVAFLTVFYVLCFALNGAGRVKVPMAVSFVGLVSNILLSYLLINKYGLMGAALATTITAFIAMSVSLIYSRSEFGTLLYGKNVLRIILAASIIAILKGFFPSGRFSFIFSATGLFILYLAFLFLTKEIGIKEFSLLKKMLLFKRFNKREVTQKLIYEEKSEKN